MLHTYLYRKLNGKIVGKDFNGNVYYEEKFAPFGGRKRRWVLYKDGRRDGSLVPAMWHGWLHGVVDTVPEKAFYDYDSEEAVQLRKNMNTENFTGTQKAHSALKSDNVIKVYDVWRP